MLNSKGSNIFTWAVVIFTLTATAPALAAEKVLHFNSDHLLFSLDANASGYRSLTEIEPGAGDNIPPLLMTTYYPQSDDTAGLDISIIEEEGPQLSGTYRTFMVRTNIPLSP